METKAVASSPSRSPAAAASSAVPHHSDHFNAAPERHAPPFPGALPSWRESRSVTTVIDPSDYGEVAADFTEYGNYDEITAVASNLRRSISIESSILQPDQSSGVRS